MEKLASMVVSLCFWLGIIGGICWSFDIVFQWKYIVGLFLIIVAYNYIKKGNNND